MFRTIALIGTFLLFNLVASAQKPALAIEGVQQWPFVSAARISDNGKYVSYFINNVPKGSKKLVIKATDNNWKREYPAVSGDVVNFTSDNRYFITAIPGDSLIILSPGTDTVQGIANVSSYKLIDNGSRIWLAYLSADSAKRLIVRDLKSSRQQEIGHVSDFIFAESGTKLFFKVIAPDAEILQSLDPASGAITKIRKGAAIINWSFNADGSKLAFICPGSKDKENELWYYSAGMPSPQKLIDRETVGMDSNLVVDDREIRFSADGSGIIVNLTEKSLPSPDPNLPKVDIWHYKDLRLQSEQLKRIHKYFYAARVNLSSGKLVRLQQEEEEIFNSDAPAKDYSIVYKFYGYSNNWLKDAAPKLFAVSHVDGSRKFIPAPAKKALAIGNLQFSPDGKWVLYYDVDLRAWLTVDGQGGRVRNITKNISRIIYQEFEKNEGPLPGRVTTFPVGIAGWIPADSSVLIYDNYDIWQVDLTGRKKPASITNGYGYAHHIRFRLVRYESYDNTNKIPILRKGDTLLLSAYNDETMYNGFYRLNTWWKEPELLSMSPCVTYIDATQVSNLVEEAEETFMLKSKGTDGWVVSRRSATSARNFYFTRDFKNYTPLSDLQPQRQFNWLTSELQQWKDAGGRKFSAVVYKPENFDPKKKHPVLFCCYELSSGMLYTYHRPGLTGAQINIPWFVSNGYIVCVPDITYEYGYPGRSALSAVEGAAKYLSHFPWVDAKRLGICGHSFGGFETDYIVTHSKLFSAALGSAAKTDLVASYNGMAKGAPNRNISGQTYYEQAQGRIPFTLWERPDLYLENSPVLKADKVSTPLLIMHCAKDDNVPFVNATELFTALRRLGKLAWLLQYDDGGHGLPRLIDQKDYTIRITQFFDHYLKGAPPPLWLTEGIPARRKGIDSGLGLDTSGKQP